MKQISFSGEVNSDTSVYFLSPAGSFTTRILLTLVLVWIGIFSFQSSRAQSTVIPTGSFIVNMGVVPQTVANGLKPYGMLYALLQAKVPVDWVINTSKAKDGVDFSYGGVDYKGGPFIIRAGFRNATVNSIISSWQTQGVVGITTTSPVTVPVYMTFFNAPKWTLDQQNGKIALTFFSNAGIPPAAFGGLSSTGWKTPAMLDCCDDIFVMPHADPIWATHGHLYEWISGTGNGTTSGCKGAIWLGCHAGSALEDMFKNTAPVDYNMQTNFLCSKTGPASGAGPYFENALLLWGNHDDGTVPYSYDFHGDPVMQFMGTIDAATQNGSEQIYIPKGGLAGWYDNTKIGVYDPDHPERYNLSNEYKYRATILGYGPGFSNPINGNVMLEACHNIAGSTGPANVAAQRAFFNYSFLTASQKAVIPSITGLPDTLYSGTSATPSYTLEYMSSGGPTYTYATTWSSSCGGTFSPNNTSNPVTFTPPSVSVPTQCNLTIEITDPCGRKTFDTHSTLVLGCALTISKTITAPTCYNGTNGSIAMSITGGAGPYTYNWSRTSPAGTGSGSGTTISGLSAGTYSITVTNTGGCTGTTTAQVSQPAQLTGTPTVTNITCLGTNNGAISLLVAGGTSPYTFNWADLPGSNDPQNRSGLSAASYSVTITDSQGCTATASATVTQPSSGITIQGNVTNVSCYGGTNGAITLNVTGGTSPYTYNWGSGITSQNRSGLSAGSYTVVVTDTSGCTAQQTFTVTQPDLLTLTTGITHPGCPPSAQFLNSNGAIDLTVTGGTTAYTYLWTASNGGTVPPGQSDDQDLTGLTAGTYSVTVTDSKGCTASATVVLNYLNPNPVQPGTITN